LEVAKNPNPMFLKLCLEESNCKTCLICLVSRHRYKLSWFEWEQSHTCCGLVEKLYLLEPYIWKRRWSVHVSESQFLQCNILSIKINKGRRGKYCLFYRTTIHPAMLYGVECWPTKRYVQQLNVAEMHMLQWICGHTRRDCVRNVDMREIRGGTSRGEACKIV
jgi:hypothetical protein